MHVTVIVGDYGSLGRALPLVARSTSGAVVWLDARMSHKSMTQAVIDAVPEVTSMDGVLVDPIPVDCPAGVHDWRSIHEGDRIVASRCLACGTVEQLTQPLPAYRKKYVNAS